MFVATTLLSRQIFVETNININFCRVKHIFVATKHVFCRDKHALVATKIILWQLPPVTVQHCWANEGRSRDCPVLIEEAWCYFRKDRILFCTSVFGFLIGCFLLSLSLLEEETAERRLIRMKTLCSFDRRDGRKWWGWCGKTDK